MKNYMLLLLAALLIFASAQAQTSCCSKNSTESFALLGKNKAFAKAHLQPLPFNYAATTGKTIRFKTATGADAFGFEVKSKLPSTNYLFVFHEWWGLNDYIKLEAERLQKELDNVTVIAIDLYDQGIAKTPEEAQKLMSGMNKERGIDIIKSALLFVGPAAHVQNIGWCFGGGWALQAALLEGKQATGCVMYYGMPETSVEKLKLMNSDVLGIFAVEDKWINADVVKKFQENMLAAGKKLVVKNYEADHAFANPSNPKFNKKIAAEANGVAMEYMKERLVNK
jgi:carboxymethylenebutenolidase